jgi:hypothetical protein
MEIETRELRLGETRRFNQQISTSDNRGCLLLPSPGKRVRQFDCSETRRISALQRKTTM